MDHRPLQNQRVETEPPSHGSGKIYRGDHAVHVNKGGDTGRLTSVNGEVANFHLEPERDYVKASHLSATAGGAFDLGD